MKIKHIDFYSLNKYVFLKYLSMCIEVIIDQT